MSRYEDQCIAALRERSETHEPDVCRRTDGLNRVTATKELRILGPINT